MDTNRVITEASKPSRTVRLTLLTKHSEPWEVMCRQRLRREQQRTNATRRLLARDLCMANEFVHRAEPCHAMNWFSLELTATTNDSPG